MLTLHQPPGAWGLTSISPFCMKLETWLRMAGIPYRTAMAIPVRAPKGKVPYVEVDGQVRGDSALIIRWLTERFSVTLDEGLSAEEAARGHAIRRMLEEGTYWTSVHQRWVEDAGFAAYRPVFLDLLPPVIGRLILFFIRRRVRADLRAQGTGRHTPAEVQSIGIADIDALAALIGDRPFVCGDQPRTVDATVFAFIEGILGFPVRGPIGERLAHHPNLLAYRDRMRARYFPAEKAA